MKTSYLVIVLILTACSSQKGSQNRRSEAPENVSKSSFKKEKVLLPQEIKDYISDQTKSESPALQDESLDRYSSDELKKLEGTKDPLMAISLSCSQGDYEAGFAMASKNYNRYQKIPAYWTSIANCHLLQGNQRKALLFYNKAIEVSPGYIPALNNIGVLYSRQGEDQKALIAFDKANKQSRFTKSPRYNLARLYLRYGLAEIALPYYQGLLNDSPNDLDLINAVAHCYFIMSDYQKASAYFSKLPAKMLEKAEFGLNYAMTLKKIGKSKEALALIDKIEKPKSKLMQDYYAQIGTVIGVKP
jgi:tetratricopeptide (TPR) repeat protein